MRETELYDYINRYWWATTGKYPTPEECESIVLVVGAVIHLERAKAGDFALIPIPSQNNRGQLARILGMH